MKSLPKSPIFCERCTSLALAVLDGVALCETCLFSQVSTMPLQTKAPRIEPLEADPHAPLHVSDRLAL